MLHCRALMSGKYTLLSLDTMNSCIALLHTRQGHHQPLFQGLAKFRVSIFVHWCI